MLRRLRVSGYRSLQAFYLELGQLNLIVGANGSGKSNLYRSLQLLQAAARGTLAESIAHEGGMPSVLWAGERRKSALARTTTLLEFDQLSYELSLGLPGGGTTLRSAFVLDPEVKEERITAIRGRTRPVLLERKAMTTMARNADGVPIHYPFVLQMSESVLSQVQEPHVYPELAILRQELLAWRFYHAFRTDALSPLRASSAVGVRTPVLHHDGRDLAAALQTLIENELYPEISDAIESAFPGAQLHIHCNDGRFGLALSQPSLRRPLTSAELSDGTLRYLCLISALLSTSSARLLILNEPETSLHPDLLEPLAKLVVNAASRSQTLITTHSEILAGHIERLGSLRRTTLEKIGGATGVKPETDE